MNPIIVNDTKGRVVAVVSLGLTLYFKEGHSEAKRAAVAQCFRAFAGHWQDQLAWIGFDNTSLRRVPPDVGALVSQYLQHPDREKRGAYWGFVAQGGTTAVEASECRAYCLGQPETDLELSFACFDVPLEGVQEAGEAQRWLKFVKVCCELLKPVHGYSGPTIVTATDDGLASAHENDVYALARRYKGLDVDYPIDHSLWLGDALKGAGWLTVISEPLVNKLGGLAAVRPKLPPQGEAIDYEGGLILRASPVPELGDTIRQEDTPGLRAMTRITRPIRVVEHGGVGEAFEGKFDQQAFGEWLRRFDDA